MILVRIFFLYNIAYGGAIIYHRDRAVLPPVNLADTTRHDTTPQKGKGMGKEGQHDFGQHNT